MKTARVNINRASRKALETLPLIGPKRAARIIMFRRSNGWFATIDDLDSVPGIGKKIISRIRGYITL
ncbi:MAG: ComEA family DNA-binding protein [Candidatus Aureabacteria bacterium]|nr:ComEA family DNA-binding protein [Candidatus Auribacterota bacterium]